MSKRSKASTKQTDSDTLAFAKAINSLGEKQEDFIKAVNAIKELKAKTLSEIQLEIKTKRDELNDLQKDYENKKKDLQIKLDQELKEYGYEKAIEIIGESGEIGVDEDEYNELKESIEKLKEEHNSEMEEKLNQEKLEGKKQLSQALKNKDLEHKAEIATLTATVQQLTKERETFETTFENLKSEIAAQRELTKQVAEAGKQGAITQTFGK